MTEQITLESLNLRLDGLEGKLKEVSKQFASIQRSLDAIYEDRDLLTDLQSDLIRLRELVVNSDRHNETLTEDIKTKVTEEVQNVKVKTEEIKHTIPNKIIAGILKSFEVKDTTIQKKSLWKKLTSFIKFGIK